ncbi:hypothetical protein [Herbidospora mongoliensis]|uniref:hypothetical protein n=1 Tax=Herbidospora mongoliensis TaxID=688067 RepID=UPI0012FA7EBA|nr:hypothetical protein [Herbidospora mongoliensis]
MVGTMMAGIAAVAALAVSLLALGLQLRQQSEQQEMRKARFASKVTWWGEKSKDGVRVIAVQNSSSEPMRATIILHAVKFTENSSNPTPSTNTITQPEKSRDVTIDLGTLSPCAISRYNIGAFISRRVGEDGNFRFTGYGPSTLTIIDPSGTAWARKSSGELALADIFSDKPIIDLRDELDEPRIVDSSDTAAREPSLACSSD